MHVGEGMWVGSMVFDVAGGEVEVRSAVVGMWNSERKVESGSCRSRESA